MSAEATNVYTQVQFRFDLRKSSEFPLALETWHTFPIVGDGIVRSRTNVIELAWPGLEQVLNVNGAAYFRVVSSQNRIPVTSVRYELVVQNGSGSTVSNLVVSFAGSEEDYSIQELAPLAATPGLIFNLNDDFIGCRLCIEIRGVYSLEYDIDGEHRYYSFRPNGQQFLATIDGTETGLKNEFREPVATEVRTKSGGVSSN